MIRIELIRIANAIDVHSIYEDEIMACVYRGRTYRPHYDYINTQTVLFDYRWIQVEVTLYNDVGVSVSINGQTNYFNETDREIMIEKVVDYTIGRVEKQLRQDIGHYEIEELVEFNVLFGDYEWQIEEGELVIHKTMESIQINVSMWSERVDYEIDVLITLGLDSQTAMIYPELTKRMTIPKYKINRLDYQLQQLDARVTGYMTGIQDNVRSIRQSLDQLEVSLQDVSSG